MFTGNVTKDLALVKQAIKQQIQTDFDVKKLIGKAKLLGEEAIHSESITIVFVVKKKLLEKYRDGSRSRTLAKSKFDLEEKTYQDFAVKELCTYIKSHHKELIIKNIKTPLDIDILKETVKPYSTTARSAINKDAIINYFSHCVFMYRKDLNKQPLRALMSYFKTNSKGFKWLKKNLRDDAIKEENEYWPTGNHEWLPTHLICFILERAAGINKKIKPFVINHKDEKLQIIDWLSVHSELRSPIKHLYFKNDKCTLASGHTPAIRNKLDGRTVQGVQSDGSKAFHDALNKAFFSSTNPREFVRQLPAIAKLHVVSGKKHLNANRRKLFTVEGVRSNNPKSINQLRHALIRPEAKQRRELFRLFSTLTVCGSDGDNIDSCSSSSQTEYTDSEYEYNSKWSDFELTPG